MFELLGMSKMLSDDCWKTDWETDGVIVVVLVMVVKVAATDDVTVVEYVVPMKGVSVVATGGVTAVATGGVTAVATDVVTAVATDVVTVGIISVVVFSFALSSSLDSNPSVQDHK
jgi:hypothetical protein